MLHLLNYILKVLLDSVFEDAKIFLAQNLSKQQLNSLLLDLHNSLQSVINSAFRAAQSVESAPSSTVVKKIQLEISDGAYYERKLIRLKSAVAI